MTPSRTDPEVDERTRDRALEQLDRDAPTSAAIARATEVVPVGGITSAADVDDALAVDIGQSFSRWGRVQLVGMGAIAAALFATTIMPAPAMLVAIIGLVPAMLVGNFLIDRAAVNEFVQLGLSRDLSRRLMRKTYAVPEAYAALPATLSSSPAAKQKVAEVIKKALAKC